MADLEAHPDAVVRLTGQHARPVSALSVVGEERDRLWRRWVAVEPKLDGYAGRPATETPVIVLEPRDGPLDNPNMRQCEVAVLEIVVSIATEVPRLRAGSMGR